MHTPQLLHTRRSLTAAALILATISAPALQAQTVLTGNHKVTGNLDATGDLGWGVTSSSAVAGKLRYFISPDIELSFDATQANAVFTWNDNAGTALRDKMRLDQNNAIHLYPTAGGTASITMTPNAGAIKLAGTNPGIYNSSGSPVLQMSGSRAVFPSQPLFTSGIDFGGTGGTLDTSKMEDLQSLLTGFGYDPNQGSYTAITKLNSAPGLSVTAAAAQNGYLYLAASIYGTITLDSVTYDSANGQYAVIKIADDGSVGWVKQIQLSSGSLMLNSIEVNESGTVALAGGLNGTTSNLGAQNMAQSGGIDGFVLVLNSSGTPQWSKVITNGVSPLREDAYGVAIDASGNVAVVGESEGSTINFGNGTRTSSGGTDAYVVKYNSSGTAQWSLLAGGSGYDGARDVAFASNGNVIVAGAGGTTTSLGAKNFTSAGMSDAWAMAFSSAGAIQWATPIGGTGNETTQKLGLDSSDNAYLLAQFSGSTTNLGSHNKTSAGSNDALVVALNTSGAVQWSKAIGSSGSDYASELKVDAWGSIVVSGTVTGSITNLGAYNLTAQGESDGFFVSLNTSGSVTGSRLIGGSKSDGFNAVPLDGLSPGGYLFHGYVGNTVPIGNTRLPSGNFAITVPSNTIVTDPITSTPSLAWGGFAGAEGTVAIGTNAFANGLQSAAFNSGLTHGENSFAGNAGQARGKNSVAFGVTTASGEGSASFGLQTSATGAASFAAGHSNAASGSYATAFGDMNLASGEASVALGWMSSATGQNSIAAGENNNAAGWASVSLGAYNWSAGFSSTTLGMGNFASGDFSLAAGSGTNAASYLSSVFGQYNLAGGSASAWVEEDPLFEIGNGVSGASNAVGVLKNGRTTLTNKAWKAAVTATPTAATALADPAPTTDSGGKALVVEGHTELQGKVIIVRPQGDISPGIYQ
ncbi:hypothetical protein [Luteolibacter luteus]|uniref:Trimeric autotransporter adhesin YadA-like head domain-containing protein n=1 Tax=Luteolibacter luteus TaxID=2728835 RepID=A0A858RRU7_9BACT|nr:hypothetical protein [Luteolibacter luteus]QJE99069.1 hypothetical protein HHL09_25915 [Luteolibacter luteus]